MATKADYQRIGNYARMYNKDRNIDRSQASRTVPLEVLCLGYSRTGTMSMNKALSILGYPNPYHFSSFYDNTLECEMWLRALDAKYNGKGDMPDKSFFDGLLGHVGAVTDAPCNLFAKELIEFYPDAKVVLVERNLESWYESWMAFCENALSPVFPMIGKLDPSWAGRIIRVGAFITHVQAGYAKNYDEAKARSKDAYRHHYRDVKEMTPKDRLLEFDLASGWEPLCKFLDKPIPHEPFPHVNEKKANAQSFVELTQQIFKLFLQRAVMTVAIVGAPVAGFLWYRRQN